MKLVLVRDGITYELGATCTFEFCITGRLPPHLNVEADVLEQLLALLERAEFFKQMAMTLKTHHYQGKRSNCNETDDEITTFFEDDVPF